MLKTLAFVILLGGVAVAQEEGHPRCAALHDQLAMLHDKYGENPVFLGASGPTQSTTVLTINPDGTSWTYLKSDPAGLLCAVDAGMNWKMMPPTEKGTPL